MLACRALGILQFRGIKTREGQALVQFDQAQVCKRAGDRVRTACFATVHSTEMELNVLRCDSGKRN